MNEERRLTRLSDVQEKPLKWIWPGYLAEGVTTDFSGDPGTAKSTITYDLVTRITTGQPMPNSMEAIPPAGAVLLQGEDLADSMVKPALAAAGADLNRIFIYDPKKFVGQPLVLPDDLSLIKEAAAAVQAKLLVIDPVTVFFACNANSDQSVRKSLKPLASYAEHAGLAVMLVRHLNKSNSGNLLYQASGSIAWTAAARCAIRVINDPTNNDPHRHLLVQTKTNLISAPTLAYRTVMSGNHVTVEWLGTSSFGVRDLAKGEFEDGTKLWEAMEVLYLILKGGPEQAQEIYRRGAREGVARRTLERAKKTLRIKTGRAGHPIYWHWEWRLPNESNPVLHYLQEKYAVADAPAQQGAEVTVASQ
jgi:hypothetical protein